ncbi:hypothetical protein BKA70DRAFT_1430563 [Coprinopsis sp. MPI-PUGE-AT-0042]|nr:hypothetical protein BKA70DRAFT_1430563 [Coprinopsis sp. MPI-PUGE-AT-0042]
MIPKTNTEPTEDSLALLMVLLLKVRFIDAYLFDTGRPAMRDCLGKNGALWRANGSKATKRLLKNLDDWHKLLKSRIKLFDTELPMFSWPSASVQYMTRLASARGEYQKSGATSSVAKAKHNLLGMVYAAMLLYASQFSKDKDEGTLKEEEKVETVESLLASGDSSTPSRALFLGVLWTPLMALMPTDLTAMSTTNKLIIEASNAQAVGATGPQELKRIESKMLRFVLERAVGDGSPVETLKSLIGEISTMMDNTHENDFTWYKPLLSEETPSPTKDKQIALDIDDDVQQGYERMMMMKRKAETEESEESKRQRLDLAGNYIRDDVMDVDPLEDCGSARERAKEALNQVKSIATALASTLEDKKSHLDQARSALQIVSDAADDVQNRLRTVTTTEAQELVAALCSERDEAQKLVSELEKEVEAMKAAHEALEAVKRAKVACENASKQADEAFASVFQASQDQDDDTVNQDACKMAQQASQDAKEAAARAKQAFNQANELLTWINTAGDVKGAAQSLVDEMASILDNAQSKADEAGVVLEEVNKALGEVETAREGAESASNKASTVLAALEAALQRLNKALEQVQQAGKSRDARRCQQNWDKAESALKEVVNGVSKVERAAKTSRAEAKKAEAGYTKALDASSDNRAPQEARELALQVKSKRDEAVLRRLRAHKRR